MWHEWQRRSHRNGWNGTCTHVGRKEEGHMLRRISDAQTPGNRQRKSENQVGRLGKSVGLIIGELCKGKVEDRNQK